MDFLFSSDTCGLLYALQTAPRAHNERFNGTAPRGTTWQEPQPAGHYRALPALARRRWGARPIDTLHLEKHYG